MDSRMEDFQHYAGPRDAKVVLVGEAWGETEERLRLPFVGASGWELFLLLGEVWNEHADLWQDAAKYYRESEGRKRDMWPLAREEWLKAASIGMTNVFNLRPQGNKIEALCSARRDVGADYAWPQLSIGKYVRPEYLPHVDRLWLELLHVQPNLILCLGNTAAWAILRATNIGSIRGAITTSFSSGIKTLATYHPAGMMRNWAWRPVILADLMKAKRESTYPDVRRPERAVTVSPTLQDMRQWANAMPIRALAVDIETYRGQIKSVAFARAPNDALCVPFVVTRKIAGSRDELFVKRHWEYHNDEVEAWNFVEQLLTAPWPKIFQNGLFDLSYLWRAGIKVVNCEDDTMLRHHAMYPEMQKGLGFLGSIYTDEASWKLMRRNKGEELKRDE